MTTAPTGLDPALLESHRRELTAYCYRMLGSGSEAEDAVQDTFIKAWQAAEGFEGRSSVRTWLYRIATNVCVDMGRRVQRRARPMELGGPSPPVVDHLGGRLPEDRWISPVADARVLPADADPAEVTAVRESIRLAFVTALQHLPARQRAALILCEVLAWPAVEVAELLDTTTASVNSALQRARATMASRPSGPPVDPAVDPAQAELLARFCAAFERYDVEEIVRLLHDDAVQSMPPFAMWIQGASDIGEWLTGPGIGCKGSRVVPTSANGGPAYAQYRVDPVGGHSAWSLTVLEITGGKVSGYHNFLDVEHIFGAFGLPLHLPG